MSGAQRCAIVGGGLAGLITYATLRHGGLASSEIAVFGTDDKVVRTIDVTTFGPIMSIGPGAGPLPAQRESYQCAC